MASTTHRFTMTTYHDVSLVLFISLVISSLIAAHNQHYQTEAAILSKPQSASLTTSRISNDQSQISPVASVSGGPKPPSGQDQFTGAAPELAAQMSNSIGLAPTAVNQVSQHHQAASGQTQQVGPVPSSSSSSQPLILPKVNIFASKSEIKKLLGLATQINYIENGVLNSYALGFQIPMGYALSDMIFTWQNLGPTNVNYSISLRIGNIHAVETPLINITRSGLIPRHEQVFKITLPCSGKVVDEVDVEILINISGLVPVSAIDAAGDNLFGSATNSDEAAGEFQLTRVVQQQNEMLAAAVAANSNAQQQQQQQPANDQMQADQQDQKRPQMRMVSHTLAIKRKKICTSDPVPVHPVPKQPEVRPPNQMPSQDLLPSSHRPSWSAAPNPSFGDPKDQQPTNDLKASPAPPVAEPSHQPTWTEAPPSPPQSQGLPPSHTLLTPPGGPKVRPTLPPLVLNPGKFVQGHTQESSHNWPDRQLPPAPTSSRPINPADGAISLVDPPRQQQQAPASNSLLFSLIVMSLIVSVALIALLILGSTGSRRLASGPRRSNPLDKLTALTNCIWRRTSAGSRAVNKCGKNAAGPITIKSGLIGTFGSSLTSAHNSATAAAHHHHHNHHHHHHGAKSNVSSISGLSTISAGLTSKQHQDQNVNSLMGPFCHKQTNYNTGFYHHYQQPPDLLIGSLNNNNNSTITNNSFHPTHQSPSLTSPYQITMNNNQMTKLFLANPNDGGAYSIDNNYMPIVSSANNFQAPHSDSGSVYQTIY